MQLYGGQHLLVNNAFNFFFCIMLFSAHKKKMILSMQRASENRIHTFCIICVVRGQFWIFLVHIDALVAGKLSGVNHLIIL